MHKYRLKPGQKHYKRKDYTKSGMVLYQAGQKIELTKKQAENISDKLMPLDDTEGSLALKAAADEKTETKAANKRPKVVSAGGGKWNVLHPETGKPMNDVLLDLEAANRIAKDFTPEKETDKKDDDK